MRRVTYATFLSLLIVACQDNPKTETVSFEDIAGETGMELDEISDSDDSLKTFDNSIHGQFEQAMSQEFEIDSISEFHVFDRYSSNESNKTSFKNKETVAYGESNVNPVANLYYYTFSDSTKTNNAFYNYLDELSIDASEPIQIAKDVESVKSPPLYMIVYDTVIVTAEYMCEHKEYNWRPFQDSLKKYYGASPKYEVELNCGGPLKWK